MEPKLRHIFTVSVTVAKPIVIGQDDIEGRRQLIPVTGGEVYGPGFDGAGIRGTVLDGAVDSQIIRPDGRCELSARYGVRLEDGSSFYIENNGIRTVPAEYVPNVLAGEFVDPSLYYFVTTPSFEVYSPALAWLKNHVFICSATRTPDRVLIEYYVVEAK